MTSTNLTRTEAANRARLISNVSYSFNVDLTEGANIDQKTFPSQTTITFSSESGSTFVDLRAASVSKVELDGEDITQTAVPLKNGSYDEEQGIQLHNLTTGSHSLVVEADAVYSATGEGLHRFRDPADGEVYMYTQFETADAKRVFACFDQPDIKATYDITVTTPSTWTVVTNNVVSVDDRNADDGSNVHRIHRATVDYPLSTYLVALCVGPWYEVRDEWTGTITEHPEMSQEAIAEATKRAPLQTSGDITVPLGLYCRQSLAEYMDVDELLKITKQGFDWYSEHFGVGYPFYKYDQIFCPEYNMGAMENAGAVTFRDEYIFRSAASHYEYERRADTILHEMAHMWFGDLVTMQWWDDLWLNESFATWSAAMSQAGATKFKTAWVTFANKEKAWAYGQDQLSSAHPVFSDASDIVTVDANFDGITYAKGASVLKQLSAYVGLEPFLSGLRSHFAAHAWSNATFDDLLGALEKASGRDLSSWADQWLKTTGINTLAPKFQVNDGKYTSFAVTQQGAEPGAGETRTHRIAVGIYAFNSGQLVRTHKTELDIEGPETEIADLVGANEGDLILVNDNDLTYAFMSLDEKSLSTATENIDKIGDPMARSLVWSAAWQMTRNAQMKARDFVALVARGCVAETEMAVLEQILLQGRSAVDSYADPAWADSTGWAMLRDAYLEGVRTTTEAAQLAFARAFAGCLQSAESAEILRALLGETDAPTGITGLDVDQDLRWAFIIALTGAARITNESEPTLTARIEAEQKTDSSSTGAMRALQARSVIPTVETKQKVWEEITVHGPERSNLELRHLMAGFYHVGQRDLLDGFGLKYAEVAPSLWNALSPEMALRTLEGIYPTWDTSEETDTVIADMIEKDSTPVGLRRPLREGRDVVARRKSAVVYDQS